MEQFKKNIMYKILHNVDNKRTTLLHDDNELITFAKIISIENDDDFLIDTALEAAHYINTYCSNLTLSIIDDDKTYVIVGDNNYWYATLDLSNDEELDKCIKDVKSIVGEFNEPECNELYVYEVSNLKTIKL